MVSGILRGCRSALVTEQANGFWVCMCACVTLVFVCACERVNMFTSWGSLTGWPLDPGSPWFPGSPVPPSVPRLPGGPSCPGNPLSPLKKHSKMISQRGKRFEGRGREDLGETEQ